MTAMDKPIKRNKRNLKGRGKEGEEAAVPN
jgi:hypothetical protein